MKVSSFKYDCAYKYTSGSSKVEKFGLLEVDDLNELKANLSEAGGAKRYKVIPLEEKIQGSFDEYRFSEISCLKGLKELWLDLRDSSIIYIEETQLKSLEPILLCHIKNFVEGRIIFREGMENIYGIEKAITDNSPQEILLDSSEFPIVRIDEDKIFPSPTSKHNKVYEGFVFRSSLIEAIQASLQSNRGKTREGRVRMTNVSSTHVDSLFNFISKSHRSSDIECKFKDVETRAVKDIVYTNRASINQVPVANDSLYSLTCKATAISVTVPYPSLLFGYLSFLYFKYPVGVTQQRSGIGHLEDALWDYIPFSDGVTVFTYSALTQILTINFQIMQSLNSKIPKDFIPGDIVENYKKRLNNCSFWDDLFGWQITVKMFIAWGITNAMFQEIPNNERFAFLDRCKTDTELRNTYFIPYAPEDLDASTNIVSFHNEDNKATHKRVVKWWLGSSKVETLEERISSGKKRLQLTGSKTKDSLKKNRPSIKVEAVTPVSSNKGATDRTMRKYKGETNFKDNLEGFLIAINVFIINESNEDDMRGYARYVYTSMDITNTDFLHQDIIQQVFQKMIEAYYYSLPKWKEIFSFLLTDYLTNQNELAEITTKQSLATFLTKVVTDTIW